jgi:hypothetical protein
VEINKTMEIRHAEEHHCTLHHNLQLFLTCPDMPEPTKALLKARILFKKGMFQPGGGLIQLVLAVISFFD